MTPSLDPGARIRVLRTGDRTAQEATLVSLDQESLTIQPGGCCIVDTMPIESVAAIDVSRGIGISAGRVASGMLVGALAGGVAGWVVGEAGCHGLDSNELCGIGIVVWPMILGAGGAVLGALWGIERKVERWERVYPPTHASILMAPTLHGGLALGAAIPFDIGSPNRAADRK